VTAPAEQPDVGLYRRFSRAGRARDPAPSGSSDNRRRRHCGLGKLTPVEFGLAFTPDTAA
jgi:hypothetical protein